MKIINEKNDIELTENGYTIFNFFSKSNIATLQNFYDSQKEEVVTPFYSTTHSKDIELRFRLSDFIREITEPLLNKYLTNYTFLGAAYVIKRKKGNKKLQAHQDWNLVDEKKESSYNIWIPLVDVDENNGAMHVLKGSHNKTFTLRGPQIPSPFINIENDIWPKLEPLKMKAGEALLYNHSLIHGSSINQSNIDRSGIVIGIMPKNTNMKIYGLKDNLIQSYHCSENYFLRMNINTDYQQLAITESTYLIPNPYTFDQFQKIYLDCNPNLVLMNDNIIHNDKRSFFEKYSLQNCIAELKYRLSKPTQIDSTSVINKETIVENKDVGKFYNEQTDNFLKVYGNVIQAFRTKDVSTLLNYQIQAMGLKEDMNVLDAGCGVCGPAIYFSAKVGCTIEAISISSVQVNLAKEAIANNKSKVNVREGDYHTLENYYNENSFDIIYFLESFGHAHSHELALDSAWKVLKPGGSIYIKDLFIKKASHKNMALGIEKEIQNINNAYHYNVPDLNTILDYGRKKGFILSSLKTIDIPLEEFENLTISNGFQELTGINKIENLREYVFPVDFFELTLIKPSYDSNKGTSRYFLQNMYFLQTQNWKETDL